MTPDEPSQNSVAQRTAGGTERRIRRSAGINTAFRAIKAQHASNRSPMEVMADRMIGFASSTPFLVIHAFAFIAWIFWNLPISGLPQFDPYPYGMLTMTVSLEAIFLSIFVLMAQKRESAIAELREEMSLQVGLRLELEVTKALQLLAGLYTRLGHKVGEDPELMEMLEPLDVAAIERELTAQIKASAPGRRSR
jgi:uncharacterized membrane protein